jgi:hypothetical protein
MSHSFQGCLNNIERRLEDLTNFVTRILNRFFNKVIIDNAELQRLFRISLGTAFNWRARGLIALNQKNNRISYKIEDVNKILDDNHKLVKK